MKRIILLSLIVFSGISLQAQNPKQEVRAVWLTTNYQLDWPSKAFLNSNDINEQQEELIEILDKLKAANFNLVFLQTRLRGDVIYNSRIEPVTPYIQGTVNTWSKYDPLSFAVNECHKRGLECHAWFVCYPLGKESERGTSATVRKNKELVRKHNNELYLDPGDPRTTDYLTSLITEMVSRYDIDGVHLDYVRYPDKSDNFPDNETYKKYGNGKDKASWRRDNITTFITRSYDAIKSVKPWVQVSSSVVGMYDKLEGSNQKHWTAYDSVYQDPKAWVENGKQDFIVPMMYYCDDLFYPFVEDWLARCEGRYVVPGLGVYQLDEKEANWPAKNIYEQIRFCRWNETQGNAFYRNRYIMDNKKGLMDQISSEFYSTPAVLPPLSWISDQKPERPDAPSLRKTGFYLFAQWGKDTEERMKMMHYNLYRSKDYPVDTTNPENLVSTRLDAPSAFLPIENRYEPEGFYYVVTAYDRFHNESEPSEPIYFITGDIEK